MAWTKQGQRAMLVAMLGVLFYAAETAAGDGASRGWPRVLGPDSRSKRAATAAIGDDAKSAFDTLVLDSADDFFSLRMKRGTSDARDEKSKAKKQEKKLIKLFKSTDANSDGFVTKEEYLEKHTDSSEEEVGHIMRAYDLDRDGRISRSEFLQSVSPGSRPVECDFVQLQFCGIAYLEVSRRSSEQNSDVICQAFQEYLHCLEGATADCQLDNQLRRAINRQRRRKDICPPKPVAYTPSTPSSNVAGGEDSDNNKRRHSRYVEAKVEACGLTVAKCDQEFVQSATTPHSVCLQLAEYRRCIISKTRCNSLKKSLRYITRFYNNAGICQTKSESRL